jgi:hypothetical protein
MNDFILPDPVASQLQGLPYPVHLCDASGKKVGTFVPSVDVTKHEIVGPEPGDEELRKAEQSTEWYSTDEVLRHLESLK